jgi:hypothetical protein
MADKRRLNIEVVDGCADDATALACVQAVVALGRISGKSYCLCTTFKDLVVLATYNGARSDSFRIERG